MREFVGRMIVGRIVGSVAPDRLELRGALAGSPMVGLAMIRYVLRLEPLASATPDEVVAAIGPNVQRYLTGDVELPGVR